MGSYLSSSYPSRGRQSSTTFRQSTSPINSSTNFRQNNSTTTTTTSTTTTTTTHAQEQQRIEDVTTPTQIQMSTRPNSSGGERPQLFQDFREPSADDQKVAYSIPFMLKFEPSHQRTSIIKRPSMSLNGEQKRKLSAVNMADLDDAQNDRFLSAEPTKLLSCAAALNSSSLLTFHKQGGDPVNWRGDKVFQRVENDSIVCIYANVNGGRYLSVVGGSGAVPPAGTTPNVLHDLTPNPATTQHAVTSTSTSIGNSGSVEPIESTRPLRSVRFDSRPVDLKKHTVETGYCQFYVRKASRRMSLYSKKSGSKTGSNQALRYGDLVTFESVEFPGFFLQVKPLSGNSSIIGNHHPSSNNSNNYNNNNNGNSTTTANKDDIFGYLQLVQPTLLGYGPSYFSIRLPTLRQLVQLNGSANRQSRTPLHLQTPEEREKGSIEDDLTFLHPGQLEEDYSQQEIMRRLGALPMDCVYRILSYRRGWIRTARLVCKDWCRTAELHVRSIRVNGEFSSIETPEERNALMRFVSRCPNLVGLSLRNVDDLNDEDMDFLAPNKNIKKLALGGCRRLSDNTLRIIGKKMLGIKDLNLASTSITDEALKIIAECFGNNLRDLNLYACQGVTRAGISNHVPRLQGLEMLNLRGCLHVDKSASDELQRRSPNTRVLTGPIVFDSIYG